MQYHHHFGDTTFEECTEVGPGKATLDILICKEPARMFAGQDNWWKGVLHQPLTTAFTPDGLAAIAELLEPTGILLDTTEQGRAELASGHLPASTVDEFVRDGYSQGREHLTRTDYDHSLSVALNTTPTHEYRNKLRAEGIYSLMHERNDFGCLPIFSSVFATGALAAMFGYAHHPSLLWPTGITAALLFGTYLMNRKAAAENKDLHNEITFYDALTERKTRWAPVLDEINDELAGEEPASDRARKLGRAAGTIFDVNSHKPGLVVTYAADTRQKVLDFYKPIADITDEPRLVIF